MTNVRVVKIAKDKSLTSKMGRPRKIWSDNIISRHNPINIQAELPNKKIEKEKGFQKCQEGFQIFNLFGNVYLCLNLL